MVDAEFTYWERQAAVLAAVIVSGEQVTAIEAECLSGNSIISHQPNNAWDLHFVMDGTNPVHVFGSIGRVAHAAQEHPGFEVIVGELSGLDFDDLGQFAVEHRKRATHTDHVHRHEIAIQN